MWGRRRRRQSVDEYVYERGEQLHQLGGEVRGLTAHEVAPGEVKLQASLVGFGARERGFLGVLEVVRLDDQQQTATRYKYAYQAMYGKERLWRYDRDPESHPEMPQHKHVGADERRVPSGRVTLNQVMMELWAEITTRER